VDRIIDTAIGSAIALMANILFSPEWAYQQFGEYLQKMLEANKNYFSDVSSFFTGHAVPLNTYKLSRKEAYVALANISDALNRMTAEPKSKQKNAAEYHELVVLNYMMSSHTATLAAIVLVKSPPAPDAEYKPVVHAVIANLDKTIEGLKIIASQTEEEKTVRSTLPVSNLENSVSYESGSHIILDRLNERINKMVQIRRNELERGITEVNTKTNLAVVKSINDQFNFIWKISEDLLKIIVKRKIICVLYFMVFYF
ncbi:MAG TPA: hypothetical protein VNW49_08880, partial [Puia sp.]|nr:hypothetical protein [Puia sp.]